MNFTFDGKKDDLIFIEDGFVFPSMSKQVQYSDSSHSDYRIKRRSTRVPFTFSIPLIVTNKQNTISRDELNKRIIDLLYSDLPKKFKVRDSDWHFIGEFNGPFELPPIINGFTQIELEFTSQYSVKFYDEEKVQKAAKTVTINTKSQLPTIPLIELTGLTGTDVQVSISGDEFRRIRLTGNIPSQLTIDIENEEIYETNSGLNRINLLRYDSAFEDFRIKDKDVVVLTNASETAQAKLTYKELLL